MTDKQIVDAAKASEKKTEFGELVYSQVSRGVNSAYGIGFLEGAEWAREQMMKDAIPCKVFWHDGPLLDYTQEQQDNALERIGANVGDKVKVIIVKED